MIKKLTILILVLATFQSTYAQDQQKIDKILQSYAGIKQFNGNILVVKNNKTIFAKSYGMADFEWNIPNSQDTKFRIGSNTKFFTSVLVMQLVEQQKIKLDSNILTYLPWYQNENGKKIKIKQLLSHTSGLQNYTERPDFYDVLAYIELDNLTFAQRYLQEKDLLFEPGTKYNYCNTDYYLLGLIIEAVTKKDYETVLQENVLNKVGMKNSGIDVASTILPKRALGYDYTYKGYVNAKPINMAVSTYAAGAMYSTVGDMELWLKALDNNHLISENSKKMIYTPVLSNQGFGVFVGKLKGGKTVIVRPGGINGFAAYTANFIEDGIHIIALDNSSANRRSGSPEELVFAVYQALMGENVELPKIPIAIKLGEAYQEKGIAGTIGVYHQIKVNKAYDIAKAASALNGFGYSLLSDGKAKDAVQIFKLAVNEFPKNANAYDSYAEALAKEKQYALAVENYKQALKLDPENKNAEKEIARLSKLL